MATIALNIGVSVAIFTTIIVGLVTVLMVARSQLVAQGEVAIGINGDPDKTQKVAPGQSLLSALGGQKILIPSACGGGGTCAMCKCQVIDGGGDVLPTELGHLSLKERKTNWRLACQVKVKQDMQIKLPEEIFGIKKFDCVVRSNDNVATFIKELVLEIQDDSLHFESGGYIQIDIPPYACTYRDFDIQEEYHEDWDTYDVWKYKATLNEEGVYRAYSMANHPAEGNIVMLNVRIATPPRGRDDLPPGIASSYIFNLKAGDKVSVSGPFGEFFIKETEREMVYIGGGAGMAPLRSHIFHLFHTLKTGRKVSYWYGARSMREVFYMDEFQAIEKEFSNFSFHLALSDAKPEDNWDGPTGFIHNVCREQYLDKHEAPEDCEYYTCGPPMMLSAVRNMLDDLGVPAEQVDFDDFGG